tara:strand:- start:5423 stop:6052 length:630 start_codon:yes stop_codon:yes gene_type:complete
MKRNYHTELAFLDLLFNTLLCFAALFALSFILINPSKQNKNVESKADFIITVTWPADMDDDVDTYVEDPQGNLVAFMRREQGLMHLDRDDVGFRSDRIETVHGVVEFKENREIVTLRGTLPGEYVVNVHMYTKRSGGSPTPVAIRLEKLTPFKIAAVREVTLMATDTENGKAGEEKTAFRFILNSKGEVISVNHLEKQLANRPRTTLNE